MCHVGSALGTACKNLTCVRSCSPQHGALLAYRYDIYHERVVMLNVRVSDWYVSNFYYYCGVERLCIDHNFGRDAWLQR